MFQIYIATQTQGKASSKLWIYVVNLTSLQWFFETISSKEMVKPCAFVTLNITISHIFPENFIDIPQAVQKT